MVTRDILNSHSVSTLKKEISKTNVKGYSKMKKAEVVDLMMKNKERFAHIKHKNLVKSAKVQAIAKDFAASVAKGNKVAERVRKTKEVAPPKKAKPKRDPNKVNVTNVFREFDDNELSYIDHEGRRNDIIDYHYGPGATFGMTDNQLERVLDKVSAVVGRQQRAAISAFLKGKKFKSVDDAVDAFYKFANDNKLTFSEVE